MLTTFLLFLLVEKQYSIFQYGHSVNSKTFSCVLDTPPNAECFQHYTYWVTIFKLVSLRGLFLHVGIMTKVA